MMTSEPSIPQPFGPAIWVYICKASERKESKEKRGEKKKEKEGEEVGKDRVSSYTNSMVTSMPTMPLPLWSSSLGITRSY